MVSGNEERRLSVLSEKDHLSWECEKGALGDGSTQPHEWVPWNQTPSCVTQSPGTCHRIRDPENAEWPSESWHQHNSSYYFGFYRYDVMYSSQQPMWIKIVFPILHLEKQRLREVKPFPRVSQPGLKPRNPEFKARALPAELSPPLRTSWETLKIYLLTKYVRKFDFVAHSPHPTRIQTP